jgi:HD-GYP domain-containing protein (c-di-GMP phosphodiesterase class II)
MKAKPLKSIEEFAHISKGVLLHHERYDGTCYSNKLEGKEILLISRVISISDAFEAMTSHRPYRKKVLLQKRWLN